MKKIRGKKIKLSNKVTPKSAVTKLLYGKPKLVR